MPAFDTDDCYTEHQPPRERSKGVAVASVLSPAELARAKRWSAAYRFCAVARMDSIVEAERIVDRLEFVKFERARGRAES